MISSSGILRDKSKLVFQELPSIGEHAPAERMADVFQMWALPVCSLFLHLPQDLLYQSLNEPYR
jgi:hypothetical protein